MTVKEWLQNGRGLQIEIQALQEARNNALCDAIGGAVNYGTEKVQTSPKNITEQKFASYSQYAAELECRIEELMQYRAKMLQLIARVPSSVYRALLTEYYINGKTWEQTAEILSLDLSWILKREYGARDKALKIAQRIYEEKRES